MTAISLKSLNSYQILETVAVLAATMGLPILLHLLPAFDSTPLGARLLPMFIAPLVASLLYKPHVGLLAALFAPLINFSITARPASEIFLILCIELVVFTLVSLRLKNYQIPAIFHVVLALSVAKLVALFFMVTLPFQIFSGDALTYFVTSSVLGLPGLLILTLIAFYLLGVKKDVR